MLALVTVAAGGSVSAAVGSVLVRGERAAEGQQVARRTELITGAVTEQTGRYVDTLSTVAAAAGAVDDMTEPRFAQVVAPLRGMRLAGASSIAYLVPASDDDVGAVQAHWRTRGVPSLTLQPARTSTEHMFSVLSSSLDGGNNAGRLGIDVVQALPAADALRQSRSSGRVTVSDPYELLIDRNLPAGRRQHSFVLTAPVLGPPDATGLRPFRGWVLMGLRSQDFTGTTLVDSAQDLMDVTLLARDADHRLVVVASRSATESGARAGAQEITVPVADRQWTVRVAPVPSALLADDRLVAVVTVSGAVLSLLLSCLVFILVSARERAETRVQEATAELQAAEVDARTQAHLLNAIMESISDGVGVVDHDGEFLLHNPAAKAMLGIEEDRAGQQNWQAHYGIFLPDGQTSFPVEQLPLVRALRGESSEQVEMVIRNAGNPDGVTITVSGRPLITSGGHAGAVAVFHDVTARKAAEADLAVTAAALGDARDELTTQHQFLVQTLDAIDVGVLTCDRDGAVVHLNRTARQRLGIGDQQVTLAQMIDIAARLDGQSTPTALQSSPLVRALNGEVLEPVDARITVADGSQRDIVVRAQPLWDAAGRVAGAITASTDVTEQRDREADLRAFAGVVAHDLRSPLTSIAGYAEIVQEGLAAAVPGESLQRPVERIQAGVRRAVRLIEDLLAFATARDAVLAPETFPLADLVSDVIAERTSHLRTGDRLAPGVHDGAGVLFPDIYCGELPNVHADRRMIQQLLDNLIGNALKYTLPGQPARVDISAHSRGDDQGWVRVTIADRGIGIPAEDQPHVFASHHRSAAHRGYQGTGLGLAICRRVVERHGGIISVADNPGGGTRMIFTLPTVAEPGPVSQPRADRLGISASSSASTRNDATCAQSPGHHAVGQPAMVEQ